MKNKTPIGAAARCLAQGGLVIIPTDTVYGIAANACDETAVAGIYAAKGRSFGKALIVFVKTLEEAEKFAEITPLAQKLAKKFLPGPLSLVLKAKPGFLAPNVTGGLETIGIRIPGHETVLDLLAACPFPLAVTSANKSGAKNPRTLSEVGIKADLVIEGGKTPLGVESTVVDARAENPKILRPGALSKARIKGALKP